ncbi:ABC transporter permease [uncultured Desulfovibrio sp.]|jgi:putative ABC transport system permease protein|uniref:ABC transporter permease n=1 Tax=uncultured Desulfovibrio sp. TaxID=167968 RepID=UPI00266CB105|nr:ABC transporter permease [uncultured Desulfovibrio sp.]
MAARTHRVMCRLACRDYLREALLSACAVLGLAAVLTPLLVLYGVKFGVVQTLTDRLQHDPRNLEVSPVSSGRFTLQDVEKFAARPDVAFALPRTRAIAATMDLRNGKEGARKTVTASLEPSAAGDPLLARYGVPAPVMPAQPLAAPVEVTLSAPAAEKLGCSLGDTLTGTLERRYQGQVQRARVTLRVAGVLPLAAQQKDVAFVPLPLAQATEDYRDGRAVPELGTAEGWTGEPRPEGPRLYPGFRLYASSLEAVTGLREFFAGQGLEVYTHAAEIEQVTSLSRALNTVFALICAAAAAGFLASTASSALAGVKRKERMLGLLRLTGFGTGALLLFPLVQALLTALLGTATAMGVYAAAAAVINHLFAASLGDMEQVCRLLPRHVLLVFAAVAGLALTAALGPALRATRIEPSEVIRDV